MQINLLKYKTNLKTKKEENKRYIYDPIRRKYLVLQPEELVRQLVIQYFIKEKNYKLNHIAVEKMLIVNERRKRFDILVYKKEFDSQAVGVKPWLLVECKAPEVPINEATFLQIANYNLKLKVDYLLVTNGIDTYCCKMNYETEDYTFLEEIPTFTETEENT